MNENPTYKVLIVDDEAPARTRLRTLLKRQSSFQLVAECKNGPEAMAAIARCDPDLLFLDVQMPGMDGFEVLNRLQRQKLPLTIFVTAYDQYALRAFEAYAIDYLLKPFSQLRFFQCLERAKGLLQHRSATDYFNNLSTLLHELQNQPQYRERFLVKHGHTTLIVKAHEVDWIEARDNYCCLHCGKEDYLVRDTLQNLERQLHPRKFFRVHRCTIVNIDRIKEIQPRFHGDHTLVLNGGQQVALSRTYWEHLRTAFEQHG